MQANQYLRDRVGACRRLAGRQREPEMAQALRDLADVYERQLQASGPPPSQMR